jgi:TatD DNase family protein
MPAFPTPSWKDFGYWQKRKKGKWRTVAAPVLAAPVADTHAHLEMLADPALSLARCAKQGLDFVCCIVDVQEDSDTAFDSIGTWRANAAQLLLDLEAAEGECPVPPAGTNELEDELVARPFVSHEWSPEQLVAAAERIPQVRFAIGCHPHNAKHYDDALEELLIRKCRDPRVAAIGEIGLDYHYDFSPRDDQRVCFRRQISVAKRLGLPIALHLREAHDDALAILREEGIPKAGCLLHCCSLSPDEIRPWVELGCHVAYGGPLTFNDADACREGALEVPLDKLVTETDSPYMTPVPLRGVECGPDFTIFTAELLARLIAAREGITEPEALQRFHDNALALLDRGPVPCQRG